MRSRTHLASHRSVTRRRGIVAGLNDIYRAGHLRLHRHRRDRHRRDSCRHDLSSPAVVTPVGDFEILNSSVDPRFIDTKSRPVLAQTFEENATGSRFTVAVNHLKSKGSACDDVGDPDAGGRPGQLQRHADEGSPGARRLAGHRSNRQRRSRLPDHRRPEQLRDGRSDQRHQGRSGRHGRHTATTTPTS